ncbi:MAG: hypothetical protein AAF714_00445 [Pseudomonadota bacterium]
MNSIARLVCATGLVCVAAFHPQVSAAEGFTGADFAAWPEASQDSYIQTSVTMAGVVLAQVRPDMSRCIDGWYFASDDMAARNKAVRNLIAANSSYHPSGVILAAIQQACGSIKR